MLEVQKERFQHLLANSILEMWKKETGSSLSVLIEGTICISSCHGKVTVIQISSQFPGMVHQDLMSPMESNVSSKFFEQVRLSKREDVDLTNSKFRQFPKCDDNNNNTSDFVDEEEMLDVVDDLCVTPVKRDSISGEEEEEEEDGVSSDDERMQEGKVDSCECSANDSAIHDVSAREFPDDRDVTSPRGEGKKPTRTTSDSLASSSLLYSSHFQGGVGVESALKNHLLGKQFLPQSSDKPPISPESERSKSPAQSFELNQTENFKNNRVKFPISPMWPIKKEFHDKIFENPMKLVPQMNEIQSHLSGNPLFPGFIPAAHSSNLNNYLRLHSLSSMVPSHVAELTNRSLSVPVFSPTEEKPFDLMGRGSTATSGPARGDSLSAPAATNNEQKIYKCLFCNKTFLFKSKYHEHLPVHTSARPFQCHLCSRTYKYKYDLRVHLRTHLGIPTKSTICPFCSNKFTTNKQLRQHIRDEHNEQQRISDEQCAQSLLMALPSA